jgi:hypothetical protein
MRQIADGLRLLRTLPRQLPRIIAVYTLVRIRMCRQSGVE